VTSDQLLIIKIWSSAPWVMLYFHINPRSNIALRAIQNSKFKIHSEAMTRFLALLMS